MADQLQQVEGQVETDVLAAGRSACYKVRDQFYECIEKTKSTPTEVASVGLLYPKECKSSRIEYEKKCRPTWIKHFDRLYCGKKRVRRLLDKDGGRGGPISLPQRSTFDR
ncbi:hypothetical protein O6H91_10G005700 [Diphasiastrum complanatum]|uniref:Uncharacterized protein n=1 Tax=Diphasiastrum complanatum TaxID=34168 RepID=A0ACC2CE85_DIPCM|nr:hypothetical protein O6H91_10G005700 [Diphasiastrum complanatum]